MLLKWYRQPARDVSEAVLRLRRLRGLTQEQLAERMGTKQPAVARLERGHENTTLKTLISVAEALDATVRIDLDPGELLGREPRCARWWERVSAPTVTWESLSPSGATICVTTAVWTPPAPAASGPLAELPAVVSADALASLTDRATYEWLAQSATHVSAAAPERRPMRELAESLG